MSGTSSKSVFSVTSPLYSSTTTKDDVVSVVRCGSKVGGSAHCLRNTPPAVGSVAGSPCWALGAGVLVGSGLVGVCSAASSLGSACSSLESPPQATAPNAASINTIGIIHFSLDNFPPPT